MNTKVLAGLVKAKHTEPMVILSSEKTRIVFFSVKLISRLDSENNETEDEGRKLIS